MAIVKFGKKLKDKVIVNGVEKTREQYKSDLEDKKAILKGTAGSGAFPGETAEERAQNYKIYKDAKQGTTPQVNLDNNEIKKQDNSNLMEVKPFEEIQPNKEFNLGGGERLNKIIAEDKAKQEMQAQPKNVLQEGYYSTKFKRIGNAFENIMSGEVISNIADRAIDITDLSLNLIDNLKTYALGDTRDVKKSKALIRGTYQTFNKVIDDVNNGADPTEARLTLEQVEKEIVVLESKIKERNMENVGYWGEKGGDLAVEINNMRITLNDYKNKLNEAILRQEAIRVQQEQQQRLFKQLQ